MAKIITEQIMSLKDRSLEELKSEYEEVFSGEKTTSNNKVFLWRKIAWRLQELEHGGISTETKSRIDTLIKDHDPINHKTLRAQSAGSKESPKGRDTRLPIPGTVITKKYKDQLIEVKVLDSGFEFKGQHYRTLTKIAEEITGSHWSGFNFFNLE